MTWRFKIAEEARAYIKTLPRKHQRQVYEAIANLPNGDVRTIKSGRHKGFLRRRSGRYRIFFALNTEQELILVASVSRRDEQTYR